MTRRPSGQPVPVTVKVEKINPKVSVVYYGNVTLNKKGDEKTVLRFDIDSSGAVTGINTRQASLVHEVRK